MMVCLSDTCTHGLGAYGWVCYSVAGTYADLVSLVFIWWEFLALSEAERRKKEEAERRAKLDEIAERQRQRERELEEKERLRKEALLGWTDEPPPRPTEPPAGARQSEPVVVAAAASTAGKYVPKFLRERTEGSGVAPRPESDRWSRQDDRPSQSGDRWRSDDRRPSFSGGGGSRSSTWSSSRIPPRGGSER